MRKKLEHPFIRKGVAPDVCAQQPGHDAKLEGKLKWAAKNYPSC